jgi:hypothetical protein
MLLFVGNSYVGTGDLHELVADLLVQVGREDLGGADALIHEGYTWEDHLAAAQTPGSPWEAPLTGLSGTYGILILQEQSQIPGFPQDEPIWLASVEAGAALDAFARGVAADTVLLQTWGRRDGDAENPDLYPDFSTMQDRLTSGYASYADALGTGARPVAVAQAGEAFRFVHDDILASGSDPLDAGSAFVALYAADGSHPSAAGSWLAACAVLGVVTGASCDGLVAPPVIDPGLVPILTDAADRLLPPPADTGGQARVTPAVSAPPSQCGCAQTLPTRGALAPLVALGALLRRRSRPLLACLSVACSDYEIAGKPDEDPLGVPDVRAVPGAVDAGPVCGAVGATVTIENVGTAPLTVESAGIDGSGWAIVSAALPSVLDPGMSLDIGLDGSAGEAVLTVLTDDPDTPLLDIPLFASADQPPSIRFVDPVDGVVLPDDLSVNVVVAAEDDVDDPESILVEIDSDQAGPIGFAMADGDGIATIPWPAPRTPTGTHQLTAATTDSCGATATAVIDVCQQGTIDVESLALDTWHFEGVATWDLLNGWLQLTHVATDVVGTAFNTGLVVSGDQVEIAFAFRIGGGTGADGISLTALDTTRQTTFLGGTGCGIGYGGDAPCTAGPALPGWSIEVDTWYNADADPTEADHLSFHFDGDVDDPAVWVALPEMEDTGWHDMVVSVTSPRVRVEIDGVVYVDQDLGGHFAFPAWVGFTAGTGGATNEHLIDALTVTELRCEE